LLVKPRLLGFSRPNSVQLRARGRPYFRSLLSKNEESLYSLEKDVSQLRKTIDKQKLRRRELDDLKDRFPQLRSAAKDQE